MGHPAVLVAVAVGPAHGQATADADPPNVVLVEYIDTRELAQIAGQLQLTALREVPSAVLPAGDFQYELTDASNNIIARFA